MKKNAVKKSHNKVSENCTMMHYTEVNPKGALKLNEMSESMTLWRKFVLHLVLKKSTVKKSHN